MNTDLQRLPWVPFFVSDYLGSTRVQAMEDFQRGWYVNLICHSWQSHPVGYLIHDGNLWRLAGARSRAFFDLHKAAVLACFQSKKENGREWLYQPRTLEVLHDQTGKYRRQVARSEKGVEVKRNGAGSTSASGSSSGSFYRKLPQPGYNAANAELCIGGCGAPRVQGEYCGSAECETRHKAYVKAYWERQRAKAKA